MTAAVWQSGQLEPHSREDFKHDYRWDSSDWEKEQLHEQHGSWSGESASSPEGCRGIGCRVSSFRPDGENWMGARPAAQDAAYTFDEYERIVNRDVTIRMLYEWPTLTNPIIYNNISNGLNGFQFSYDIPPSQIQVVVQAYATANLAMYDDGLWAKYRLGEIFKVQDPTTGEPAVRNVWFASKNPPMDQPPADRSNPYYSDLSIEGLQRRGVLFLI